jgi:hypothetical protein
LGLSDVGGIMVMFASRYSPSRSFSSGALPWIVAS